jgi:7-dehydrocholesterol reductase
VPLCADEPPSQFRMTVMPLVLLLICPPLVLLMWATAVRLDGSLLRLTTADGGRGLLHLLPMPSLSAAFIIVVFAGVELLLLLVLPGEKRPGPVTPRGNQPSYRKNGVLAFFATHALFWAGVGLHLYPASIVYDHHGDLLATLCLFALCFCGFLWWKAKHRPSSNDITITGNPLFDYFQGMELHPRIFGVDLKQLCNCRIAMMGWGVLIVSFAAKQHELYGHVSSGMIVSVALQLAYILKFFVWEQGYFASLDIMHDRFGFYICWGVLCWLPCVYTLSTLYLTTHPADLSPLAAGGLFAFGMGALAMNYAADLQRQRIRASGGCVRIWGRTPRVIEARYVTGDGTERTNLLLASGYWGLARHFHYLPELALALAWTLPVGSAHLLPYFYFVFLTILLVDRAGRDDRRCEAKYGPAWHEYRRAVPYKILPGVY